MTDVHAPNESLVPRRLGIDFWLNTGIVILLLGVLGVAGYFGYTVYQDQQRELYSSAAGRIVAALSQQVRRNPNDVTLRVRLGEAFATMGKYPKAVEQHNAAIKLNPKHTGAYLDLGMVAQLSKRPDEARRYYQKVIDLTEGSQYEAIDTVRETALYNLGVLALDDKKYEDAAGYLKGALRIRKDASDTYYNLARALRGLDDIDGAIQNLEFAISFDPNFAEAQYFLGQLYKEKKDDVNASYAFMRAAQSAPDADPPKEALEAFGPPSEWLDKARKAYAAGDVETALTDVLVTRNLDPKNFAAAKFHAEILVSRGDLSAALKVYKEAAAIDPKNAEVQAKIAELQAAVDAAAKKAVKKKSTK